MGVGVVSIQLVATLLLCMLIEIHQNTVNKIAMGVPIILVCRVLVNTEQALGQLSMHRGRVLDHLQYFTVCHAWNWRGVLVMSIYWML